jgi:pilus assembly protein CpaE
VASRVLLLTFEGGAADQVVQPLEQGGMSVSVARDPATALQRLGEHQLVIINAPDAASLLMLCRRITDEAGSAHPPILAVAHTSDVDARVRLLEAGADDVVALPIDERELEAIVGALLLRSPGVAQSEDEAPHVTPRPTNEPGRVIAFASAKGGSGTTTLAVNTAVVLAQMAPGSVAIADLDMYHGQVSAHLDIYARSSTTDLARESEDYRTSEVLAEAGRQHSSGLTVFGGPYRPDDGVEVEAADLTGLVDQMRTIYGTLVVDVGSVLDMRSMAVLDRADTLALVLTPDIPSLRLLHSALQVLSESGTATDRAFFIVNQVYPRPMIGGEQIEEHLGIKVGHEVPYDGESFMRAINDGQPLVTVAHRSAAASSIRRLAAQLTDATLEAEAAPPQRRRLFRGLLSRK